MVLIKVTINGQDQGTYTPDAYEELRLQMCTGDFHVHRTELKVIPNPHPDSYIDLDLLLQQVEGL